jgi:hypothetical protein
MGLLLIGKHMAFLGDSNHRRAYLAVGVIGLTFSPFHVLLTCFFYQIAAFRGCFFGSYA